MRISDWSSDVCSSDLGYLWRRPQPHTARYRRRRRRLAADDQGRGGRAALPADRRHPRTPIRPTGTGNPKPLMTALSVAIKRLDHAAHLALPAYRSEEHTSELQSLMSISYALLCLQRQKQFTTHNKHFYVLG